MYVCLSVYKCDAPGSQRPQNCGTRVRDGCEPHMVLGMQLDPQQES